MSTPRFKWSCSSVGINTTSRDMFYTLAAANTVASCVLIFLELMELSVLVVVGRSSVFNRNDTGVQRRKRELEQRPMKAKQERVTEIFGR
jgi:hypothetical protein